MQKKNAFSLDNGTETCYYMNIEEDLDNDKQFYQLVSRLFGRTLQRRESSFAIWRSSDPNFYIAKHSRTSSKRLEKISYYNIGNIEKIEAYGTSILIINGTPWACDKALADDLEDYLNGKKEIKKN